MEKTEITLDIPKGYWLPRAIHEAIELSKNKQCIVNFEFNDILLTVTPNDGFNDIMKQYNNMTTKQKSINDRVILKIEIQKLKTKIKKDQELLETKEMELKWLDFQLARHDGKIKN